MCVIFSLIYLSMMRGLIYFLLNNFLLNIFIHDAGFNIFFSRLEDYALLVGEKYCVLGP